MYVNALINRTTFFSKEICKYGKVIIKNGCVANSIEILKDDRLE